MWEPGLHIYCLVGLIMESFVWLWKTEYFVYCEAGLYISKFYNFFPGLLQEDIFPQINLFPDITLLSSFVPFFLLYSSHFLPFTMFSFLFSFIFHSSLFLSLAIFVFSTQWGKYFFKIYMPLVRITIWDWKRRSLE